MFNTLITKEVECPECLKQHKGLDYRYIDVLNSDKEVVGHVALGFMFPLTDCLAHLVFELWSRGSFKAFKTAMFSVIIPGLKELGITKIVIVNPDKDINKWTRFIRLLHFSEPETYSCSTMEL